MHAVRYLNPSTLRPSRSFNLQQVGRGEGVKINTQVTGGVQEGHMPLPATSDYGIRLYRACFLHQYFPVITVIQFRNSRNRREAGIRRQRKAEMTFKPTTWQQQ